MKARIVCAAAVAMVLGQGCFGFDDSSDWDDTGWGSTATPAGSPWTDPSYDTEYRTLDIQNAQLNGSMGEIRGFNSQAYETTGSSGYGTTSVQVTVEHRGRYAMAALSVSGDLTAVEEGTTIQVVDYYATTDINVTQISALACGGTAPGQWDLFDTSANVQTVRVTDGTTPDLKRFEFDMEVDGDTVRGAFEIPDTAGAATPMGAPIASAGQLEGRFGGIEVSGTTTWFSDIHRTGLSSLVLENERGAEVVTAYVDVVGGLNAFAAAQDQVFDDTNMAAAVRVRAVAGEIESVSKEVHVTVTETAAGYHLDFVATFANGADEDILHGGFDYSFE